MDVQDDGGPFLEQNEDLLDLRDDEPLFSDEEETTQGQNQVAINALNLAIAEVQSEERGELPQEPHFGLFSLPRGNVEPTTTVDRTDFDFEFSGLLSDPGTLTRSRYRQRRIEERDEDD
jgi:hypothetical protein